MAARPDAPRPAWGPFLEQVHAAAGLAGVAMVVLPPRWDQVLGCWRMAAGRDVGYPLVRAHVHPDGKAVVRLYDLYGEQVGEMLSVQAGGLAALHEAAGAKIAAHLRHARAVWEGRAA